MPNAALVVETALLLLAAFLVGCVLGTLARRLTRRRAVPATPEAEAPPAAEAAPPLVVAPVIAPARAQPRRPSPARRLAAVGGPPPAPEPATPMSQRRPARTAGEISAPPTATAESDAEEAARRAVEGGSLPPGALRTPRR